MIVKCPNKNIMATVEGIDKIGIIKIYSGETTKVDYIDSVVMCDLLGDKIYIDSSDWKNFVKLVNEIDKAYDESGLMTDAEYFYFAER